MPRRAIVRLLALAALVGVLLAAWAGLRASLEARMAGAAQRGLETIVDLVAAEVSHLANTPDRPRGASLIDALARRRPDFAQALRNADDSHFRRIYFFDAAGRVLHVERGVRAVPATRIVQQALAARRAPTQDARGALFDPYPDNQGEAVFGIWRWLPEAGLGVVAERPYARFAQPLRWFDAAFAALAMLLGAGLVALALRLRWRPAFRRASARCGPYDLLRRLGDGSMGHVHLARHRRLGRVVALKRLKPHAQSDELNARFEREARLASQLSHPNIVTILDHGRAPGGGFYYAMDYIPGLTLTQWVERHGALPPDRAIRLLGQVCAAVSAMHARQLLHRDIKPDNIMAHAAHGDWDLVKLLDFGLIKDCDQTASRDLTRVVRVLGTPAFMAPERLTDPGRVDPRSDLYGIACVGFYLLAGRKPFEASQDSDLAQQVLHVEAPRVASLAPHPIPPELDALIAEALAKDPERRPASVERFRARLDAIAAGCPWRAAEAAAWWRAVAADADGATGAPMADTSRLDVSLTHP